MNSEMKECGRREWKRRPERRRGKEGGGGEGRKTSLGVEGSDGRVTANMLQQPSYLKQHCGRKRIKPFIWNTKMLFLHFLSCHHSIQSEN